MKASVRNLLVVLFVAGVFFLPGVSTPEASAQGAQDFELRNATDVDIHALYISPHDVDEWEENILDMEILGAGESAEISFSRNEEAELWDLRVEDEDGNFIVWKSLDLTEISVVTLYYEDGKAWAEID